MARVAATFADILSATQTIMTTNSISTSANTVISMRSLDVPPPTPSNSDQIWNISPGPRWDRNGLGEKFDTSDIILTGHLLITLWLNTSSLEEVGQNKVLLTDKTLGADALIQKLIGTLDNDGSNASNLITAVDSPLMEPLVLDFVINPTIKPGIPWYALTAGFFCRFIYKRS